MFKDIKKTENNINSFFIKSTTLRVILVSVFVFAIFGTTYFWVLNSSLKKEAKEQSAKYEIDIKRASEQYFVLYNHNQKLQKEIQDINLTLIETINSTVDLQVMLQQLNKENVTLYSIQDELVRGINNTNYQLNVLQKSVNKIIKEKQEVLERENEFFLEER